MQAVDLVAFLVFLAITLTAVVVVLVGSTKVHRTKRVAVCEGVLLLAGMGAVGLCYLYVWMLTWPAG
jgi:hypothetical protein